MPVAAVQVETEQPSKVEELMTLIREWCRNGRTGELGLVFQSGKPQRVRIQETR